LAGLALFLFLRPEPREVSRSIAEQFPQSVAHSGPARPVLQILATPAVLVAVTAMVMGQVVMVGLMGITSLHMFGHDHPLSAVSMVFSIHTMGMFAFSILTGQLLDRWGRGPVILSGAALLFTACALAPIWSEVAPIAVALFLLGLGWNFCFVGGSTLLSDVLTPEERARTQAANDLTISLMTALASFASGVVFDIGGYLAAGLIGAFASIIPFMVAGWWMTRRQAPMPLP
jgi:MFS family permease